MLPLIGLLTAIVLQIVFFIGFFGVFIFHSPLHKWFPKRKFYLKKFPGVYEDYPYTIRVRIVWTYLISFIPVDIFSFTFVRTTAGTIYGALTLLLFLLSLAALFLMKLFYSKKKLLREKEIIELYPF